MFHTQQHHQLQRKLPNTNIINTTIFKFAKKKKTSTETTNMKNAITHANRLCIAIRIIIIVAKKISNANRTNTN